jgi:hypothetical protein
MSSHHGTIVSFCHESGLAGDGSRSARYGLLHRPLIATDEHLSMVASGQSRRDLNGLTGIA